MSLLVRLEQPLPLLPPMRRKGPTIDQVYASLSSRITSASCLPIAVVRKPFDSCVAPILTLVVGWGAIVNDRRERVGVKKLAARSTLCYTTSRRGDMSDFKESLSLEETK